MAQPFEKSIKNRIIQAIKDKIFPGCVVGIVRKNGQKIVIPFGKFTYEKSSKIITQNSIFDVASITKSIPTSSLALKLVGEGKLNLDDKVIKYISELKNLDREKIMIKHLLTQTLDFGLRLSDLKDNVPEEILNVIFTTELKSKPGNKFSYTNAASILLGIVIERIYKDKLDKLADKYFFKPLNMTRTTFHPLKLFDKNEIVPTEFDPWRGRLIQGEVHDESAYSLNKKMVVGSAGLFSTAPDLLSFLEMVLNNDNLNKLAQKGLGWELNQPRYMGKYATKETFGKTGFTGCVVICNVEKEVGLVILSNYVYPQRKKDVELINKVRRDISDIVFKNWRTR